MKKRFLILYFYIFLFSDLIFSQNSLKILEKEMVIYYPKELLNLNKKPIITHRIFLHVVKEKYKKEKYKKESFSISLLHNNEKGEKRKLAYDVYIIDTKGMKIGYGLGAEIKGIGVIINGDSVILSIPLIKPYSYYGLNVQKGKYYLYVTYTKGKITYYSDTIPLYIKKTCKKQIKQLSK
jgi:hypothetical protein